MGEGDKLYNDAGLVALVHRCSDNQETTLDDCKTSFNSSWSSHYLFIYLFIAVKESMIVIPPSTTAIGLFDSVENGNCSPIETTVVHLWLKDVALVNREMERFLRSPHRLVESSNKNPNSKCKLIVKNPMIFPLDFETRGKE